MLEVLARKNKLFFSLFLISIISFLFLTSAIVLAAAPPTVDLQNPIGPNKIDQGVVVDRIGSVTKSFLLLAGSVALLIFVYGGFLWLTSGGNPDKVKKGKDVFLWAVIGLVVIFNSYLLVSFVIKGLSTAPAPPKTEIPAGP